MKKWCFLFICSLAFSLSAKQVEENDFKYNMNGWKKYGDNGTIHFDEEHGRGDVPGAVVIKGTEISAVSLGFHSSHCTERKKYQISVWVKGCDLARECVVRLISTPLAKNYKTARGIKPSVMSLNAADLADGQWHKLSVQIDCSSATDPIKYMFTVIQFKGNGELLVDDYQAEVME